MMLRWISLVPPAMVYCRALTTRLYQRGASGTASLGRLISTCVPSSSPAKSATRTPSSEPKSLRMEPSGPGGSPQELARDVAEPGAAEARRLDPELGEALAHERVVPRRPAIDLKASGQDAQSVDRLGVAAAAPRLALVHEGGHGGLPPFVLPADQVGLGHGHVDEEDLVEVAMAVHEHEGTHGDAGRLHVHQEVADALVPWRRGIAPHEEIDPV